MKTLDYVQITTDVQYACTSHALTTEREEIMGLLIGNIEENRAIVWDVVMLTRVEKKKDRVEISSEQLVAATDEADKLSRNGIPTRVIGWYHSHPKISPWPSHVDLNSQGNYQMMDDGFIGLIFSVFCTDSDEKGRIDVHAFQSRKGGSDMSNNTWEEVVIPLMIIPNGLFPKIAITRLIQLLRILINEEKNEYQKITSNSNNLLEQIHNRSIYSKNLTKILEFYATPLKSIIEEN